MLHGLGWLFATNESIRLVLVQDLLLLSARLPLVWLLNALGVVVA